MTIGTDAPDSTEDQPQAAPSQAVEEQQEDGNGEKPSQAPVATLFPTLDPASLEKLDVFEVSKHPITQQTQKSMRDMANYAERVGKVASFAFTPPKAREEGTRKWKLLIVMSDTGGGHKASANSIAAAVNAKYGDEVEVVIRDILEDYTLWASNRIYNWWSSVPWLWGTIYNSTKRTHSLSGNMWLLDPARTLEPSVLEGFIRCTQEEKPDCIISVHPILQSAPRATSSHIKHGKNIPFMTVVTDLGEAHPWWFNRGLDRLVVPTEAMREQAKELGLKEGQLSVCGLPVREGFWAVEAATPERKRELIEQLGMEAELPVVLLAGGGEGMGKLREVAQSFFRYCPGAEGQCMQVVIVCGSNAELRKSLTAEMEKAPGAKDGMRYRVEGFVNNMDEWMQASTVIVTKAGPGTIAEACCCGLPILLYDFLPGQEEGNVTFVKEGGLGEWLPEAKKVAARTAEVVADAALLEELAAACRRNARPRAALDIAEHAKELIEERWTGEEAAEAAAAEGEGAAGEAEVEEEAGEEGGEGAGSPKGAGGRVKGERYELRSSWWSWLSTNNKHQAPSWWRETRVAA